MSIQKHWLNDLVLMCDMCGTTGVTTDEQGSHHQCFACMGIGWKASPKAKALIATFANELSKVELTVIGR